jgi:hypothetical protein
MLQFFGLSGVTESVEGQSGSNLAPQLGQLDRLGISIGALPTTKRFANRIRDIVRVTDSIGKHAGTGSSSDSKISAHT